MSRSDLSVIRNRTHRSSFWSSARTFSSALALVFSAAAVAHGQATFQVVKAFDAPFPYGALSQAPLIQATDGSFYGTARLGGPYDRGTLFKLDASGVLTTVHGFTGAADGGEPCGALLQAADGSFYGTASAGGEFGYGVVFRVTPGGILTTLHSFKGVDGALPQAGLVQAVDGTFYGTTSGGGAYAFGTVFRFDVAGTFTTVHSFAGGAEGKYPAPELIQAVDGNLYGVTAAGGEFDKGTVFELDGVGALTTLHSFAGGAEGAAPYGRLIQRSDGSFYGTTEAGGGGFDLGTVFKLDAALTLTTIHAFTGGDDGVRPAAGLIEGTDGKLYGTTTYAGGAYVGGTVFRLDANGTLTTLHTFAGGSADGAIPAARVIQAANGNIYGTTVHGGTAGVGTVFRLDPISTSTTDMSFPGNAHGANLRSLLQATDGNLYGTSLSGGVSGGGTVYRLDPAATLTTVHSFYYGSEGMYGQASRLIQAADGDFYGTTMFGGVGAFGTIFKIDSAGTLTTLHTFNWSNGAYPAAGVIQAIDGSFYGTTTGGGAYGNGTVFRLDGDGTFTTLHSFVDEYNGSAAPLIQGSDGDFYGTTQLGGASLVGTVFRIDASGTLTTLYTFTGESDGAYPDAGVIQASDGTLYGATSYGGGSNRGTVFKLDSEGTLTTLHSFEGATDGGNPGAGLIQATDGNFYGVTARGGASDAGTLFKLSPDGTLTTEYTFSGSDGANPRAELTYSGGARFYGTTDRGGPTNGGVVFSLTFSAPARPTRVSAEPGDSQVQLQWQPSSGADKYRVKRSPTRAGPFSQVAEVTGTAFTDKPLTNGVTYYYVITAVNIAGESAPSNRVSATPIGIPAPPTGVTAVSGTRSGDVIVSWNASAGATSYNVERGTTSGGPYTAVKKVTRLSITQRGLTSGQRYYFVVRAVDAVGESAPSAEVSVIAP